MARVQLPVLNAPFSGDVTQTINPWTWFFAPSGGQFGLFNLNIDLGPSSNPEVETEIVRDVASYGKQIGRIEDVVAVLVNRLDPETLSADERKAVEAFKVLLADIETIKARHTQA